MRRAVSMLGMIRWTETQDAAAAQVRPQIANLAACVEDARQAALSADEGPAHPLHYAELRGRLQAARHRLPPLYRESLWDPYVAKLDQLGESGFAQVLVQDPGLEGQAALMLDIAHAVLQNAEAYQERATDAFQEVVSDLYDGFLSAEDRRAVAPPEHGAIPPLVKWGNPGFGPYTWTAQAVRTFGVLPAIVSLPPANARRGLLAWSALGHETAGHDILHADEGLLEELASAVYSGLGDAGFPSAIANYWADRIDETASDVLGVLNLGPAAGIGLVGYFRGLNAAYTGYAQLRSDGPAHDSHPADVLRGFLAAACVGRLQFAGAQAWAAQLYGEAQADAQGIVLGNVDVPVEDAARSADVVAQMIMSEPMPALEGHALGYIQNWRDMDEAVAQALGQLLAAPGEVPADIASGLYAAHAVSAGVMAALSPNAELGVIFDRMLGILKHMHDTNPSWGPLYVRHPGNLVPHRAYVPHAAWARK